MSRSSVVFSVKGVDSIISQQLVRSLLDILHLILIQQTIRNFITHHLRARTINDKDCGKQIEFPEHWPVLVRDPISSHDINKFPTMLQAINIL